MPSVPDTHAPFRAEHLGSLLRPKALLEAREAAAAGKETQAQLDAVTDKSVADAIAMQAELGFHAITDGEYR